VDSMHNRQMAEAMKVRAGADAAKNARDALGNLMRWAYDDFGEELPPCDSLAILEDAMLDEKASECLRDCMVFIDDLYRCLLRESRNLEEATMAGFGA